MAKLKRTGYGSIYYRIDVPSDKMYTCFYCGDFASEDDHVPPISRLSDYQCLYDKHQPLLVPSCKQCNRLLGPSLQPDIYQRVDHCKVLLTRKLGKYVRYGEIWDDYAAERAEFSGSFQLFVESAAKMAEIVDARLNWEPWPVSVEGDLIERAEEWVVLKVRNKTFTSLDHVFEHARKVDKIPPKYLEAVLEVVGISRLEYGYNICVSNPISSEADLKRVIGDLVASEEENKN